LERAIYKVAAESEFSAVLNGRFKGGWTTRHYGRPSDGVHAIQMELAQSVYLTAESPPWTYDEAKTARLRPVLRDMLQTLIDTATEMRP
jgi:formiminoglutamase